jgi:hypothetical protein
LGQNRWYCDPTTWRSHWDIFEPAGPEDWWAAWIIVLMAISLLAEGKDAGNACGGRTISIAARRIPI